MKFHSIPRTWSQYYPFHKYFRENYFRTMSVLYHYMKCFFGFGGSSQELMIFYRHAFIIFRYQGHTYRTMNFTEKKTPKHTQTHHQVEFSGICIDLIRFYKIIHTSLCNRPKIRHRNKITINIINNKNNNARELEISTRAATPTVAKPFKGQNIS